MRQGQKCWHNGRRRHPLQWPLSFPPWLFENNSQVVALDFMVPLPPFKKTHTFSAGGHRSQKNITSHYFHQSGPLPVRRKVTSVRDLQLAAPSSTADPLPATTPQLRCSPAPAVTHCVVALALAKQWSGPEGPRHLGHRRNRYRSTMKQCCTTL